ncbi:universal stress protein [Haloarchaeobius sp. DFWS5]|uniref:universal stress protein n=1 Tax=Haloarchaeobius sp. DFWS5 TaxID=3446114 RepID=UPI003EBA5EA7
MPLLERIVVPVANDTDASATAAALSRYLDEVDHLTVAHVIAKGGGAVDKAPMEKRQADANQFLSSVESRFADGTTVDTRIEFGTSVAETIVETALDVDATAIVFRPRGGNRLVRFLSGDTGVRIAAEADVPVVSIRSLDPSNSPKPQPRPNRSEGRR